MIASELTYCEELKSDGMNDKSMTRHMDTGNKTTTTKA